ncbi:hypothetical protein PHYPSEUDO_014368 [Phytophthora pseudosyringae]|uniref:Uncharacterized protein n=1 Tax=Phytophthora pseudosyringae TaxID=221518 RepID=A0A8T1WI78_9STRA|nr:hypothetical protein PHYPSEUDO_014368 [Phytophthora pseudosyringae]
MWQGTEGSSMTSGRAPSDSERGPGARATAGSGHPARLHVELSTRPEACRLGRTVRRHRLSTAPPASEYSPSPELDAFLGNDGGPIFVGFGSMVLDNPLATTQMIVQAAKLANENCPHDWLMPRVCAVVHHGGAGSRSSGRAQSYERERRRCEISCSKKMALNRSFYRHLPSQDMWCDLDHQRIATQWSVHDKMKLCDRCAFVVGERRGKRSHSSLLAGVASGAVVLAHEVTGAVAGVVMQPMKGLINGGLVGAVKDTVAGVCYLVVRPIQCAVLFADHAAAGRKNAKREEGHRKLNSVYDKRLMAALGAADALADTKMFKQLGHFDKRRYRASYEAMAKADKTKQFATRNNGVLFPVTAEPLRELSEKVATINNCTKFKRN